MEHYIPEYCTPKKHILQKRLDVVSKQIDENLQKSRELSEKYKNHKIDGLEYMSCSVQLNTEWERLYKKQDGIMRELYPKEKLV